MGSFLLIQTPPFSAGLQTPSFSNDERGLKQLVGELKDLAARGEEGVFRNKVDALTLPDHPSWFRRVFGEDLGESISVGYRDLQKEIPGALYKSFVLVVQEQRDEITVAKLERNCEPGVLAQQFPVLMAREEREPLYSVQFQKDKKEKQSRFLWFFAYAQGGFRYIGSIKFDPQKIWARNPLGQPSRIRTGGTVQSSKLVQQVRPAYPPIARDNGIQGTVRLNALIATDGSIRHIHLVAGNCYLAEEAIRAVPQWRYSPTLLNGSPVEIVTTIDVIFTLSY